MVGEHPDILLKIIAKNLSRIQEAFTATLTHCKSMTTLYTYSYLLIQYSLIVLLFFTIAAKIKTNFLIAVRFSHAFHFPA